MSSGAPRRRRAELVRETWDLTRHRGVLAGAALGALSVVLALTLRDGARSLATPGPLARPHAEVACASCHTASPTRATCGGCHAPHPSSREAHAALADAGALTCGTCHAVHRSETGLAFAENGELGVFGSGFERRLAPAIHAGSSESHAPTFVPLVGAAACASCHDLARARDPAAHCFAPDAPFSLCFDEHRRPARASRASTAARDAAVERARVLARGSSVRASVAGTGRFAEGGLVALGLAVAALVVSIARRRRPAQAATPAAPRRGQAPRRLPVIDPARCLGCNACVDACPYDALVVRRYVAVLTRPDACCGAGPCVEACPNGSLTLVSAGTRAAGPRCSAELESLERPGLFLAGDVSGGTLIRNALRQGVAVARTVAARARSERPAPSADVLDLVVIGAGPAGLAAGLTARALGLSVVVLEQAGVAASIRRFSRQKLVLDAGSGADETLPLWLGDARKEELLERWQRTIRRAELAVREGVRVTRVERSEAPEGRFVVTTAPSATGDESAPLVARAVLLAIGTRGTPRKLSVPLPEAAMARVHYELSDARAFAGQRCVIVGLGDVAMESAVALAAQPGTLVTVLQRGSGFRRGSQRNIDALAALVARGRVRLLFDSELQGVRETSLDLEVARRAVALEYDALFVHVGCLPPHELLESAGVCLSS